MKRGNDSRIARHADPRTLFDREIEEGDGIRLGAAAALLPSGNQGKRTSTETIWRWCERGRGGIKLESVHMPDGKLMTTPGAIRRFLRALEAMRDRENVDGAGPSVPSA